MIARLLALVLTTQFLAFTPLTANANHDSAETILGQWQAHAKRLHILQPSRTPRELAPSGARATMDRVAPDAQSYLRGAFSVLLIEDGALVFEGYSKGATRDSHLNSYSMAKSLTSLAVGEALCAGKIRSLDDSAATYAPQLAGTAYGAASLRNLLRYTSGAQDPGGDGFSGVHNGRDFGAMLQQRQSLGDLIKLYGAPGRYNPGEKFIYNGLDSEALSLVVRGATGMSLAAWFEQTVWQKAGAESQAGWYLDREGNAVAEILFFATTRDFARVALYVLDRLTGAAGDTCIQAYLKEAAMPLVRKGYWDSVPAWGLGLHAGSDGNTWFFGHGGQRVGINVKTRRVFASNSFQDGRGLDSAAMKLLAR